MSGNSQNNVADDSVPRRYVIQWEGILEEAMRFFRAAAFLIVVVLGLVSCNRDPNVAKKRYLDSGIKYFANGKYKEASIMYRNALQKDMRYGPAHYRLGLTNLKLG